MFWLMSISGCLYVLLYGGREGKFAAFGYAFTVSLTLAIQNRGQLFEFDAGVFFTDFIFFIYLYIMSIYTSRYWVLYTTGFQLAGVISHFPIIIIGVKTPKIFELFQGFWAIPIIISMVIGVFLSESGQDEKL